MQKVFLACVQYLPLLRLFAEGGFPTVGKGSRQRILLHCTTLYQLCIIHIVGTFETYLISIGVKSHTSSHPTLPTDSFSLSFTSIHPRLSFFIHPSQFFPPTLVHPSLYLSVPNLDCKTAIQMQLICTFHSWSNLAKQFTSMLVEMIFKSRAANTLRMMMILNHFGFGWPVNQK